MIEIRICTELHPYRICSDTEIKFARIFFRVPREIGARRDFRNFFKLVDAVAIKVYGRNSKLAQFIESSGIEVRVVKVAQEKIDRPLVMSSPNFIDNSLRNLGAHGELFLCEIARHGHEPAQRVKIDM